MIYLHLFNAVGTKTLLGPNSESIGLELTCKLDSTIFDLYMDYVKDHDAAGLIADLKVSGYKIKLCQKAHHRYNMILERASNARVSIYDLAANNSYLVTSFNQIPNPDPYANMVGELIKFKYASGQKPGTFRTIKIDSVTPDFICGVDVKELLNGASGYRKYNRNLMSSISKVEL